MVEFKESKFYKLLQDFFINNDKETFTQFLAEFYNRTEGIIDKNIIQDEIIKELREMYIKFNEEGIDENIVREKVNYFVENNEKIQDIIAKLIKNTNNIKNISSQLDNILYLAENFGIKAIEGFDNSILIQNMINSLQDGATIKFPNGKIQIDNDIDFKGKTFDIIVCPKTEFIGNGKFPMFETNDHHMRTGTAFNRYPKVGRSDGGFNNYGDSALNVEMVPQEGYRGNAVGLFISTKSDNTVRESELWGQNIVTTTRPGYEGQSWGIEIDANTHSDNTKAYGIDITSSGSRNGHMGLRIYRVNDTKWEHGVYLDDCVKGYVVKNADKGVFIDNSDNGVLLNNCSNGIVFTNCNTGIYANIDKDVIAIKKTSNTLDTDNIIYVKDTNNNIFFSVKGDGNIIANNISLKSKLECKGVKIGQTQISKLLYKRVTLTSGSINANSTKDFTIEIPGASNGDTVIINPSSVLPDGVMWGGFAYEDHVKIRLSNMNNSNISINNFQFEITCIKYN